jgi:hypothetical protein
MKKNKEIPDMGIYEASDFWDEHDLTQTTDVQEVNDVKFSLVKKKYVGVDMEVYKKVKREAKKLRKNEDTLINEWLIEKTSRVNG